MAEVALKGCPKKRSPTECYAETNINNRCGIKFSQSSKSNVRRLADHQLHLSVLFHTLRTSLRCVRHGSYSYLQ